MNGFDCSETPLKVINFVINFCFYRIPKNISNFAESSAIIKLLTEITISLAYLCRFLVILRLNRHKSEFVRIICNLVMLPPFPLQKLHGRRTSKIFRLIL
jgi:hypothetical protein